MRLEAPDKQDKNALAQSQLNAMIVIQTAIEQGVPIDIAALCERYGIPLMGVEEGEQIEIDPDVSNVSGDEDGATDMRAELVRLIRFGPENAQRAA
jgi:hypothetical protein